jgi:MerR family transcriptional regulator, light-induced transcriptional regulator
MAGGDVVAIKPYAIGTAARLAGISPETLRIWERRYDLLDPGRTDGGHRLYSEQDVSLLRAVKQLLDAGMRIGNVARMGRAAILQEAARHSSMAVAPSRRGAVEELIDEIIEQSRDLDPQRVMHLLDRPLLVMNGEDAILKVYLPLMARVGELWEHGQLSIAVEHFIEKLVTSRLHVVMQAAPQPEGGRLALVAGLPGERHEAGMLAAAIVLRRAGFAVSYLGADLPVEELVAAVARLAPAVAVLAAIRDLSDEARQGAALLDKERVPLIIGGQRAHSMAALLRRQVNVVSDLEDLVMTAKRIAR